MTSKSNLDSIMEAIDANLDYLHKERWGQRAAELHDAEDRASEAGKEQARQALSDHYADRFKPETSRDALAEQAKKSQAAPPGRG